MERSEENSKLINISSSMVMVARLLSVFRHQCKSLSDKNRGGDTRGIFYLNFRIETGEVFILES